MTLQQHPRFLAALALLGRRAERVETPAGPALVVRRLGGAVLRGPLWATPCPEARARALRALRVLWVEAEAPCPSLRLAGFREVATPATVAEIDLTGTPAERRARMRPTWRRALDAARGRGLTVAARDWDGDPAHWLLREEGAQRRARAYRAAPHALACAWARAAPGAARIFEARDAEGPVAGALALLHPPGATWQLGWTGPRGRALGAGHLVLALMADDLAGRGLRSLDLGTVDAEASPGLALFKGGAGARARALGGSWVRLPSLASRPRAR